MLKLSKIPINFVIVENGLDIDIFLVGNFLVRMIKTLGLPCDVDLFLQRFRKNEKKNSYSVRTITWNFHCLVKVIHICFITLAFISFQNSDMFWKPTVAIKG